MEMYIYASHCLFMRKIQNLPVREFLSVLPFSVWIPEPEKCFQIMENEQERGTCARFFRGYIIAPEYNGKNWKRK